MCARGVVYIAIGQPAQQTAKESINSLKRHNDLPVTVIDKFDNPGKGARWAKLNIDQLVGYDRVLYLDADTIINGDISAGFEILDDWDLAIVPSANQESGVFQHIDETEREQTVTEIGYIPIQLQAGMMFFDRIRCQQLFSAWRSEWLRYRDQDQAALIRALAQCPVRVWLLGKDWNSARGELITHLFGRGR